ncbi:MAG: type II secretion system protein GspK [Nitrospiraceae bacterium]|nr:type II secretion system protein GspK [Nitrospiraceae bacterium]
MSRKMLNERGVALLIALLVTTLLIALVFEFAYGTRVSLRVAVNFRDGQRAVCLARSGVNFAGKLLSENLKSGKAQANLEQREWQVVPMISEGDTALRVRWEDEGGKINIANVTSGQPSLARLERLFGAKGVDLDALDRIHEQKNIRLVTQLHRYLSDEEFGKIREFVTVYGSDKIDVNTAPGAVLESLGASPSLASLIVERRNQEPFDTKEKVVNFPGMDATTAGTLDITGNVFFVQSFATVGGYTRQVDAVIKRDTTGYAVLYWRSL